MILCSVAESSPSPSRRGDSQECPRKKKANHLRPKRMNDESIKSTTGTRGLTVILFGWAGCRDRYLAKYAQLYEAAGYSTIRFTMPIIQVRGYFSYKAYARMFYQRVFADGKTAPDQIVWHVFSMNGCSLWTALWSLLQKEKRDDLIAASRGIIFDSCPANVLPHQSARAISIASLPAPQYHAMLRETYRGLLFAYFSSHNAFLWLRSQVESRVWERHFSYWHLQEMEVPKNALFIYSPADDICSADSIENIVKHFAKRNEDGVHVLKLEDSPHVCHLRTAPETYTTACLRFLTIHDENANEVPPILEDPAYTIVTA